MLQDATGRYAFSFLRAKGGISREKSATLLDERKRISEKD
jgi:hypothetical protein